jgi:hypothetical protein
MSDYIGYPSDFSLVMRGTSDIISYYRDGTLLTVNRNQSIAIAWNVIGFACGKLFPIPENVWTATPDMLAIFEEADGDKIVSIAEQLLIAYKEGVAEPSEPSNFVLALLFRLSLYVLERALKCA